MKKLEINVHSSCTQYTQDIKRFVDAMLYKLEINAHKGRWTEDTINIAMDKLRTEVQELHEAINSEGCNVVKVMLECADVANYALIVASMVIEREAPHVNNRVRGAAVDSAALVTGEHDSEADGGGSQLPGGAHRSKNGRKNMGRKQPRVTSEYNSRRATSRPIRSI